MKKKLLTLACLVTCLLGLTACGEEDKLTGFQQEKVTVAEQTASQIVSIFTEYLCDEEVVYTLLNGSEMSEFTAEELSYICEQTFGFQADGYTVKTAVDSFQSGLDTIGGIRGIGDIDAKVSGKQIVVNVEVTGEKKNAVAEIILSNDMFMRLESAALNPTESLGGLMGKAALNTVIGMGTVFAVLILISLIISCFNFIPKIQKAFSEKKNKKSAGAEQEGISNGVEMITAQEEAAEEGDDLELVAVIAAAIAACEGAASTDGFVVRSIRRRA